MAPTRAHRGDAHRSPVIETSSPRALFTVFYNHRMLTRSRRVIAHTRTQRAPIFHRSSARPTFVDALFLSNDDPAPRRRSSARLRSSLHSSRPIEPIAFAFAFAFASCRRESARRSSFIEDARPSKRTRRRDDDDARRRRATTTRDDDDDGRKNRNSKSLKQTGTMADANLRINVRARVPFADKGA